MAAVLSFLVQVFATFVVVWIAIFGGTGALLARARGGRSVTGFIWGAALGPLGWSAIWWRTQAGRAMTTDEWIDGPAAFASAQATGGEELRPGGIRF